jgi:tryptophan synthase alpha subunit
LRLIADSSTEFIYYVSRTGVTGESATLSQSLREELGRIRSVTDRPIAVGFGISTPEHVKSVAEIADGIVIGSAFIRLIAEAPTPQEAEARVRAFTRACADARDSVRGRAR